jgi:hypothetical protein
MNEKNDHSEWKTLTCNPKQERKNKRERERERERETEEETEEGYDQRA